MIASKITRPLCSSSGSSNGGMADIIEFAGMTSTPFHFGVALSCSMNFALMMASLMHSGRSTMSRRVFAFFNICPLVPYFLSYSEIFSNNRELLTFACGSASITNTFAPDFARIPAILNTVVVFATPPF